MDAAQLQTYITQIQTIKASSRGLFAPTPVTEYANAIQGLEAKQAALLLSTQGLTNAQIAETLAVNESNIATNYQAMADAGLLASKQKLTIAQVQENLQTVLGAEADTSAAMASLGLSASIEGQGHQTVKLTAKKLEEAVATNVLTEAQAQEFAIRTGITLVMQKQVASTLPKWIATLKAGTKAVLEQVKATAKWLATTPAGWATAAISAIGGVIAVLNTLEKEEKKQSDAAQELYEKSQERVQKNKEEADSLEQLISKYEELKSSSEMDSGIRDEIREIQYDIVDLVGSEAKTLDLVNGKLDEQLEKLKEISVEKSQQNVEDASDDYYNAKYASETMVGEADDYGNDVSLKWAGTEAGQIHAAEGFEKITYDDFVDFIKNNGFGDIFRENKDKTLFNMRFVVDTTEIDGLEEKIARLQEFRNFLGKNGLQSTGLYQGVVNSIERYEEQQGNEVESAQNLVDSVVRDNSISMSEFKEAEIDSVDAFEECRQRMIDEAKKNDNVSNMLADGVLSEDAIETSVNNFMSTATQFSDWYEQWKAEIDGVTDASTNSSSTSFTAFTEEQSKSIDDFQSKVKTLGDALSSLQSGDTIDFTDLIQEFPELAGQSDNLEQAIQQLIYNALQELYDTLGQGLPTDVKDDLQSIADSASGVAPDLNTAFASIQKSYDAMHEFKDAMDTDGLTESILSNVGSLSSYMNQMVAGFHAGTVSADQLYQALTEHYNNDLKNYGNALIAKNLYSEDFYNAVGISSAKVVNEFNKNYGVDIQNCKNYNQAKLKIEEKTLGKISEIWGKYYDAQSMTYKPALDLLKQSAMNGNAQAQKDYAQVMQYTNAHKNATNALNKIVYEGINTSFDEIGHNIDGNGKGSSTKEDKETKETFDFIETAIKRIEAAIDKVKSKAEDTFSTFSSRSKSYAETIKTITDEISLQEQAKQKYMERRDSIGLDEYWAAQVRDGSLNIADITDDALKEQINEYGEWNDKVIECTESVADLKKEQEELVRDSIELLITKYDKLASKVSNAVEKIQNKIDLKETWGGSAKASDYIGMNKNMAKQVGYLKDQNAELKKLQKSVPRTSEAWYDYQEQIDGNSSSIQELTKNMVENAQAAASLAKAKADSKVEKYDSQDELYEAKIGNATTAKSKNGSIDKIISNIGNRQKEYKTAVKTSTKRLNSSASAINGLKSKKTNTKDKATNAENKTYNTVLKKVKAQVKKGERIGTSLLNKATGLNDNLALYRACVQYNSYLDAKEENETIAELYAETAKSEKNALALQKFNNVAAEYGNKIQMSDYQMTALDNKISEIETAGKKVERSYYDTQKKVNAQKLADYQAEKNALEESIKNIKEGTDEWYEAYDQIQQVSSSISDCVKETYELNNAINQLHFDQFDDVSESIGRIITEQEFLRGLSAHEKNTDAKTGNFTDAGLANLGSLSASYYASKENAENDRIELQKLKAILAKGPNADGTYGDADLTFNSLEDLQKEIDKTYTTWQNDIKETYSVESEIADLMKEKYQSELDLLQELIDAKKEALQSEKDLHDYQKSLNEKTKDITTIQKQIAAYSGDSSEEGMAKLQKLQKELADKEEDLRETEYDRYISDQQDMLDKLYKEYEELVTKKLDDFMTLVTEGLATANANMAAIGGYLSKVAKDNGYDVETDGLFNGSTGGIGENVGNAVADIEKDKTATDGRTTGSSPTTSNTPTANNTQPSPTEAKSFAVATPPEAKSSITITDMVKDYIKKHANNAKKGKSKSEYTDVNQRIYENKSKSYKGTGKVLSIAEMKKLASNLGVKYDDPSKSGKLYKKLKAIKFPGFKKGGIAKLIKDKGEDGITLARNGEGFIAPEHVQPIQELVESVPDINEMTKSLAELIPDRDELFKKFMENPDIPRPVVDIKGLVPMQDYLETLRTASNERSMNTDINIDFGGITMNGVNDPQEFTNLLVRSVHTVPKARKIIQAASTDMLAGAGKLSVNKIRC